MVVAADPHIDFVGGPLNGVTVWGDCDDMRNDGTLVGPGVRCVWMVPVRMAPEDPWTRVRYLVVSDEDGVITAQFEGE
jgi:hypothetical protein